MKRIINLLAFLSIVALAFAQESAQSPKDLSGFSGYAWGSSYGYIYQDMQEENYDLLYSTTNDLWYRGNIDGELLQIVYYFESNILTSGMWLIDDVDQESFWVVNQHLQNAYNSKVELTIKNDAWIEGKMLPPDTNAWIIHSLDVGMNRHVVHYYYRRGEE